MLHKNLYNSLRRVMSHVLHRQVNARGNSDEVFAYLLDFTHAEEWDSGTVRCERVSGDGGVGTRYRNVSKFLGRETELEYTTESVDEGGRTFTIVGGNSSVRSTDTVTVSPTDTGVLVDYRAEMEFSGAGRIVSPLLAPFLNKLGDDTAAQLRGVLEDRASA
jgi:hypothetical protein